MLTTRIYSAYFRLKAFTNYTYRSRLALGRILASCLLAERPLYAQDFQSTIAGNSLGVEVLVGVKRSLSRLTLPLPISVAQLQFLSLFCSHGQGRSSEAPIGVHPVFDGRGDTAGPLECPFKCSTIHPLAAYSRSSKSSLIPKHVLISDAGTFATRTICSLVVMMFSVQSMDDD